MEGGGGGGGGERERESDIFQSVSRFLSGILDVKCSQFFISVNFYFFIVFGHGSVC